LGLLLALLALIGWRIRKDREIFVLRVRAGRVVRARGRVPRGLLTELEEVLARSDADGTVVAFRSGGRASLRFRGAFAPVIRQRLRNVVGCVALGKILSVAPRGARPAPPGVAAQTGRKWGVYRGSIVPT